MFDDHYTEALLGAASEKNFPMFEGKRELVGKSVLILGAGAMQIPAIQAAKAEGLSVHVCDANSQAPGARLSDVFYPIDLKDKEALLDLARSLKQEGKLDGVFTAATDFSSSVAYISQALQLPGIDYETALNASSKIRMRSLFKAHGIRSPEFREFKKDDPLENLKPCVDGLEYPLVVKPQDNMGARGVRKVNNFEDLREALSQALGYTNTAVIIEEFIEGPEYSLDCLVVDGTLIPCGLADRHIRFPPYFIEVGHTIPSKLPQDQVKALLALFAKAVAVLGIKNGVAKGDLFMSPEGPVIGEIAARLSGGYMSGWTFPYSSGIDLTRLALRQALGLKPGAVQAPWSYYVAERALVSIPGIVKGLRNLGPSKSDESIKAWFSRCKPKDAVCFPRNNVEKCGNVIARASSPEKASAKAEAFLGGLLLRLEAQQPQTDEFLFSTSKEFPKAYQAREQEIVPYLEQFLNNGSLYHIPEIGKDWTWRSLSESLEYFYDLFYEEAAFIIHSRSHRSQRLGLLACGLVRGGLQGLVYVFDSLMQNQEAWMKSLEQFRKSS